MADKTLEERMTEIEALWKNSPDTAIPAKYAKLAWLIFVVLSVIVAAVETIMIIFYGQDSKYAAVCGVVATAVAALLRLFTTNSFGGAPTKLFIIGVLGLGLLATPGCVHFNKPKLTAGLEQCAAGFVETEVQGILPDVLKALQQQKGDWQAQLDGVLARGGVAAICALQVIMSSLESGTGGAAGAMPVVMQPPEQGGLPKAVVLLRAYSYVESRR